MFIGSSEEATKFLKNLDEKTLVDLCADILAIRKHTNIRITDGPGDGQRDIHSIDPNGAKHLVQSKYHNNPRQTVSPRELGELILAMTKHGYKEGLFITNARISPQAKSECLNDYPSFSIEFLEGRDIVKEVFQNLILKSIWFDGVSIQQIDYIILVPVMARNLENDRPIRLLRDINDTVNLAQIRQGRSEVQVKLRLVKTFTNVFDPYRKPKIKTVSETGKSTQNQTEISLSGSIHIEDLEIILEELANILCHFFYINHPDKNHFAMRFGTPFLTLLGGENLGTRINLIDYIPFTKVSHFGKYLVFAQK